MYPEKPTTEEHMEELLNAYREKIKQLRSQLFGCWSEVVAMMTIVMDDCKQGTIVLDEYS